MTKHAPLVSDDQDNTVAGPPAAAARRTTAPRRKSRLANIPLLKILVPPEALAPALTGEENEPATVEGLRIAPPRVRTIDASPFELPGSTLRQSAGSAGRGWYAPTISGAPTTTRQAEILNTGIIGAPTSFRGVINGRDNLSSTTISHDAPTAYNMQPRELTSPNVLILGSVGAGKSSFTKTVMVIRPLLLRKHRAVVFDKKDQGGQGEYSDVCDRMGGTHLRFSTDGEGTKLNLLDPLILSGSGLQGQMELVLAVARIARNDVAATEWEENATRYALRLMFEGRGTNDRTPTAADLMPFLGHVPRDAGFSPAAAERYHQAGLSVRMGLENLLETYAGVFDGETDKHVDLTQKLTTFDVSQLPDDGPAVPTVMAIGHQWLLGQLKRNRGFITNVVYEEGWHMIGGPSSRLVKSNQKLSRSLGISNVFVMHKGTDIPPESPGYTVVQEAQTIYTFRQDREEDAAWVTETFNFAPDTQQVLMNLRPGNCVFKFGSNPETHMQHIRSEWETEVTNTDEAMEAGAAA
jgi:hypothetical protein